MLLTFTLLHFQYRWECLPINECNTNITWYDYHNLLSCLIQKQLNVCSISWLIKKWENIQIQNSGMLYLIQIIFICVRALLKYANYGYIT